MKGIQMHDLHVVAASVARRCSCVLRLLPASALDCDLWLQAVWFENKTRVVKIFVVK